LPLPHWVSVVHWAEQFPATQRNPPGQGLASEHELPGGGWQAPRSHVKVAMQGRFASHSARHWPSAQIWFAPHSLEKVQVLALGTHEPATHTSLPEQSAGPAHGQGPAVPPHALQTPATQVAPDPQSVLSVQSRGAGGAVVLGATQSPLRQTSPRGQPSSAVQRWAQPTLVQTAFAPHAAVLRQLGLEGEGTAAQPKPSQSKQPVASQ